MHTPGPWKIQEDTFGCKTIVSAETDPDTDLYEEVFCCQEIGFTPGRADESEDAANARLIAAAPQLLEALERTLSWLTSYRGGGAMGAYYQARAAIAAAKGEA